jgi:hypothetical protein
LCSKRLPVARGEGGDPGNDVVVGLGVADHVAAAEQADAVAALVAGPVVGDLGLGEAGGPGVDARDGAAHIVVADERVAGWRGQDVDELWWLKAQAGRAAVHLVCTDLERVVGAPDEDREES